jgi:hypothetical protein
MSKYTILKEITETPARDENGQYTRITLSVGTICTETSRSEGGLASATIVSCVINNETFTGIALYDFWLEEGLVSKQSGGRRNRRSTKKTRKTRKNRKMRR